MIRAYYNDHDKKACAWLEQLIKNGDITKGDVDDRSITEVKPSDIAGYDRVHLFAGIGTWDYALTQAGWGDRPVLTASLPCQPFSAAGKGLGKSDERHLLPQAVDLIIKSGIDTIFGEQVERAIAHGWLDDLQAVMEAENYAVGHVVLGAHSVNSFHVRQRLYWVADTNGEQNNSANKGGLHTKSGCGSDESGIEWIWCRDNKYRPTKRGISPLVRAVEPSSIKMVDGTAGKLVRGSDTGAQIEANNTQEARTMRLKGYGNAIQAQTAEAFIRAFMSI